MFLINKNPLFRSIRLALVFGLYLVSFFVSASKESFLSSQEVQLENNHVVMHLSGHTTRTKFIFDIYSMAHYMQWPEFSSETALSDDAAVEMILSGSYPQQIDIVFQRDLKANQIVDALVGGIKSNCLAQEFDSIQNSLSEFKSAVSVDVEKETLFRLRWLPSGSVEGYYEGNAIMRIDDPLFARLLWSVWFGKHPVVDTQELLSYQVTNS